MSDKRLTIGESNPIQIDGHTKDLQLISLEEWVTIVAAVKVLGIVVNLN